MSGIGLTVAMQAMNLLDKLQAVGGMGPVGEVRLMPDSDTFVVLPYAPRSGAMLADLETRDGQPWEACPRSFLKRMIRRAASEGLLVKAAFEPEWSLAVRVDDRYVPFDESLCFSTVGMQTAAVVIDEIVEALDQTGHACRAVLPRAWQRAAGTVDRVRASAACRRQPDLVPRDGAGSRLQAWLLRVVRAEAVARSSG